MSAHRPLLDRFLSLDLQRQKAIGAFLVNVVESTEEGLKFETIRSALKEQLDFYENQPTGELNTKQKD